MAGILLLTVRLLLLSLLPFLSCALKFDLAAESRPQERCIRNFVNKDTLVVVTATVGGSKGDGQKVDMHVRWNHQAYKREKLSSKFVRC